MKETTTIGVFSNRSDAESAIKEFRSGGILESEISTIYGDNAPTVDAVHTTQEVSTGVAKGAVAGAVVGAIAGLVVANGVFPGIGTLFVAGPLAAALGLTGAVAAGTTTGLLAGGLAGALVEFGIVFEDASLYEKHVKDGGFVLITRTTKSIAKNLFTKNRATEVREYVPA